MWKMDWKEEELLAYQLGLLRVVQIEMTWLVMGTQRRNEAVRLCNGQGTCWMIVEAGQWIQGAFYGALWFLIYLNLFYNKTLTEKKCK